MVGKKSHLVKNVYYKPISKPIFFCLISFTVSTYQPNKINTYLVIIWMVLHQVDLGNNIRRQRKEVLTGQTFISDRKKS